MEISQLETKYDWTKHIKAQEINIKLKGSYPICYRIIMYMVEVLYNNVSL